MFDYRSKIAFMAIEDVLNELFTSKEERLDKEVLKSRLALRPSLVQTHVKRIEAQHRSRLVAGLGLTVVVWIVAGLGPAIGWICVLAIAWKPILRDMAIAPAIVSAAKAVGDVLDKLEAIAWKLIMGDMATALAFVSTAEAIGDVFDELFNSKEERLDKEALKSRLALRPSLVQTHVKRIEAQHRSRLIAFFLLPAAGWICAAAIAWQFILRDMIYWGLAISGVDAPPLPSIETRQLMAIFSMVFGLLAYQSREETRGRTK